MSTSSRHPLHQQHHHRHHHLRHHHQHPHPAAAGSSSSAAAAAPDYFTAEMRDRQARGKDPYRSGDASDTSDMSDRETRATSKMRLGAGGGEREDFARVERREKAAAFLDNPELLMMYAQSTGDSTPAARLHFMKMMCGYDEKSPEENRQAPPRPTRDTDKRRGGDRAGGR